MEVTALVRFKMAEEPSDTCIKVILPNFAPRPAYSRARPTVLVCKELETRAMPALAIPRNLVADHALLLSHELHETTRTIPEPPQGTFAHKLWRYLLAGGAYRDCLEELWRGGRASRIAYFMLVDEFRRELDDEIGCASLGDYDLTPLLLLVTDHYSDLWNDRDKSRWC